MSGTLLILLPIAFRTFGVLLLEAFFVEGCGISGEIGYKTSVYVAKHEEGTQFGYVLGGSALPNGVLTLGRDVLLAWDDAVTQIVD